MSQEWISVRDMLPGEGRLVIVGGGIAEYRGGVWITQTGCDAGREIQWRVTHWMPIPKLTKRDWVMKKGQSVCEFGDLLCHAEKLGYSWNTAHDILVDDEVPPMYESYQRDIYVGMGPDYGWSEDSCKIVDGYLASEGVSECTLLRD